MGISKETYGRQLRRLTGGVGMNQKEDITEDLQIMLAEELQASGALYDETYDLKGGNQLWEQPWSMNINVGDNKLYCLEIK